MVVFEKSRQKILDLKLDQETVDKTLTDVKNRIDDLKAAMTASIREEEKVKLPW